MISLSVFNANVERLSCEVTLIICMNQLARYPDFKFLTVEDHIAKADLWTRFTLKDFSGFALDISLLSECDFMVCTFSSNVRIKLVS